MTWQADVIVVGAGAAGLAAASRLTRAGVNVHVIEARDRIGGRIWTSGEHGAPIELGAEFIHGKPPETWDLLDGATVDEVTGTDVCIRDGQFGPCDFFEQVGSLLSRMKASEPDLSFAAWLREHAHDVPEEVRRRARMYVEGFNAAHAEEIGVHALVRASEAEEKNGDRQFRIRGGYSYLPRTLLDRCDPRHLRVSINSRVERIAWERGKVVVSSGGQRLEASAAVITLPLGVLRAGSVEFRPAVDEKRRALEKLAVGHVVRVALRFRERFWEREDLRFLFTDNDTFPTWWTSTSGSLPTLVGWAPASSAETLSGLPQDQLIARAVQSLEEVLGKPPGSLAPLLESGHVHDWESDAFACGAYSYPLAGGEEAGKELAEPLDETLFFAGEATDWMGNFGTVHGAIGSGYRAAEELLHRR